MRRPIAAAVSLIALLGAMAALPAHADPARYRVEAAKRSINPGPDGK